MLLSKRLLTLIICLMTPSLALANSQILNLTQRPVAWFCVVVFVLSYCAVIAEEKLHLRKSKPVMLAASIIWGLIAWLANSNGITHDDLSSAVTHDLDEYASMFFFLLVAMTYINAMEERQVFDALRSWLVRREYSFRQLFWVTGILAFCISPIADNLTTALLMGAVIMAVGAGHPNFIIIAMTSVVVAANAGGAFSPFGDITTLMVWQAGKVEFFSFFALILPSLANFMVPALIMHFFIDDDRPKVQSDNTQMKRGGLGTCLLFLITIAIAVSFETFFGLPPFMGMMAGLSLLMFYTYFINVTSLTSSKAFNDNNGSDIDIYQRVAHAEWDTLLFFFGVIFSVGGLRYLGYLDLVSEAMYTDLGPTWTNIMAGGISAIIDNIPVMFAIIGMSPQMDTFQWLLITLTTGVGGSLLSIGSAAGVALMGASKGSYTFMGHLRWAWAIALGYVASIGMHFLVNG
ncbi:MAG: sodium:proton antiporter NhaD [Candidatus Endonucleobacter sp. (ex Gigantidas childressi)]|nr:sodium:proton antiporter NhaD [Candidatus Endonucleobacter sp. (ex Gigantidas childressi)]